MCSSLYVNKLGKKKEQQTDITHKRHHYEEVWGNFYLSDDGCCLLASAGNRSHAGLRFSPHSGWYTLDRENKQLGEEKFSLSLYFSLSLSNSPPQRQSVRQRFSCVSLPSMNVTECECVRAATQAHVKWSYGIVLAPGAEEQLRGEKTMQSQCTLTTDWGPTEMSECTVWRSATCLWRETATLSCASLF